MTWLVKNDRGEYLTEHGRGAAYYSGRQRDAKRFVDQGLAYRILIRWDPDGKVVRLIRRVDGWLRKSCPECESKDRSKRNVSYYDADGSTTDRMNAHICDHAWHDAKPPPAAIEPVCECGHVQDEHSMTGACIAESCRCAAFDKVTPLPSCPLPSKKDA